MVDSFRYLLSMWCLQLKLWKRLNRNLKSEINKDYDIKFHITRESESVSSKKKRMCCSIAGSTVMNKMFPFHHTTPRVNVPQWWVYNIDWGGRAFVDTFHQQTFVQQLWTTHVVSHSLSYQTRIATIVSSDLHHSSATQCNNQWNVIRQGWRDS